MANVPVYSIDPATGQTIVTYPDGTVVPVLGGQVLGTVDSGSGGTAPTQTATPNTDAPRQQATGYERSYRARPYDGGASSYGGGNSGYHDSGSSLPRYADGTAPGQPRLPGGPAAERSAQDGGRHGSLQAQEQPPFQGGGGRSGGGGGGGGSSLYWAWRNKLTSKLSPGSSSSYGSYSSGYDTPQEPKERMHGPWAHGLDPDQAMGLALRPTAMLPKVFPGLSGATPLYQNLAGLPAYPLAILSKRGHSGSPAALANAVGQFYDKVGNDNWMPDFNTLFHNLTNPKKGGGVDQLFHGTPAPKGSPYDYEYGKEPLGMGEAAYTYKTLLDAALQSTLPQETALKYSSYGDFLLDKASAKTMKRPAGKGKTVNQLVGKKLFR